MNQKLQAGACDPERLESFLRADLSAAQEREFSLHLNTCENCRRALEQQAAEPEAWQEAQRLLKHSPFDAREDREAGESGIGQPSPRPSPQIQSVLEALGPTDDPQMLGRIGSYEVSGVIGAGGMGVVLKAIDKSLDRTVAVKVMAPHLASSGAARKRFAREAKAAAAVLHPNVIAIHSVFDDALPYLVMPYVRGTSLQKRLDAEGPLPLQEILRIGSQIAAGLTAAHAQGLVHRDIKPANILLEEGVERVAITDFGLALAVDDGTITHSGAIAGTPQYMSPEQVRGEPLEQRSDLFSLGSVLYAISTGRPPFRAETTYGVMRRITDDEPTSLREVNPDIPDWLCAIIGRLMSKRAADRFGSAAEVADLLEKCLAHVQQPAAVPLPAFLVPGSAGRRRFFTTRKGIIAMLGTLTVVLLGAALWQASEPPDITGDWTGENWGRVVLKKGTGDEYTGRYGDSSGKAPGELQLKWSRIERRFNGSWREGADQFGNLSVRLVGDEIRGARTNDANSDLHPTAPRLGELSWTRAPAAVARKAQVSKPTFGQARESVLPYGVPCMQQFFQFRSGEVLVVGRGPATTEDEFDEDWKKVEEAGGADISLGSNWGIQLVGEGCIFTQDVEGLQWDIFTAEKVVKTMNRVNFSFGVMEPAVKDLPVTYLFKTARGEVGIMQILGIVEDERGITGSGDKGHGMKFRYKLVEADGETSVKRAKAASIPAAENPNAEPSVPSGPPVRLRQIQTGDRVKAIASSPDGRFVAYANGPADDDWKPTVEILDSGPAKTIISLKLTTAEEQALLAQSEREPPFLEVEALAFSPDGNVLAVGTRAGQVKLFDVRSGALVRSLEDAAAKRAAKNTPGKFQGFPRAMGSVEGLAFSPDGSLLAVCGNSLAEDPLVPEKLERSGLRGTGPGRLEVWEVRTGAIKHDLVGHSYAHAVAFSPDGKLLASAGNWAGQAHGTGVIIWDPQTGAKLRTIANQSNGGTWAVAFSPNGKLVAISARIFDKDDDTSKSAISLAHAGTGIVDWQRAVPGWAHPVAFTSDGKNVAVLCAGRSIQFFATETAATTHEISPEDAPRGSHWTHFAITPKGGLVIGGVDEARKGLVELWEFGDANSKPASE
jgi:WD40 repeat protein